MKYAVTTLFAFALAVLSVGRAPAARAQSFYDIEGNVYGPDRKPAERVAVYLEDVSRARINQTITDSDGRYRFSRVAAGTYHVVADPNSKVLQRAVHRVELINTVRGGSNQGYERVDLMLGAAARRPDAAPGTLFAQTVPPAAEAEYEGAVQSLAKRDKERGVGRLRRALEIFPDYFLALQHLGLFYVEEEKYAEAVSPLQRALKVNPKASQSHVALGIVYVNTDQPELAAESLGRALALDAASFQGNFYLGIALLNLGRLDEAEKSLRKAYELGGKERAASARLYLASIHTKRGQTRQAIRELEDYLRDSPQAKNASNVRQAIKQLKAKL